MKTTPKTAFVKTALFSGLLMALAPGIIMADPEKKGTSPYVTHFIFRPLQSLEVPGLGTATHSRHSPRAFGPTAHVPFPALRSAAGAR